MLTLVLNWRRNLLLSLFIFLFIGSFHSQARNLCAEWWVGQQRCFGTSFFNTVRREEPLPLWYTHFHNIIGFWKVLLNRSNSQKPLKLIMMFYTVGFAGLLCLYLLRKVITFMINKGMEPSEFIWNWSGDAEQNTVEIRLHAVICQPEHPATEIVSSGHHEIISSGHHHEIISSDHHNEIISSGHHNEIISSDHQNEIALSVHQNETDVIRAESKNEVYSADSVEIPELYGSSDNGFPNSKNSYDHNSEREMKKKFYNSLSEKDKRRYAGIEALKLGHGGCVIIARLFGCTRKTVSKGMKEVIGMPGNVEYERRIRKPGGGRKPYRISHDKSLDSIFLDTVKSNTAGSPMNKKILWTNLSHVKISKLVADRYGKSVSTKIVRQLLKHHDFHRRKAQKKQTRKTVKNRNAQFGTIAKYNNEYTMASDPVTSMDTKKKEFLGLYRNGHLYTQRTIIVPDHDFPSYSDGIIIPHSIWDVNRNTGYISIGTSKDTSEFACDGLRNWWYNQGEHDYPFSGRLLILCDGGGSNSSRSHLFKQDIQKLADETGLEIRIAHYPPYTSKYNPIEHRMFPHVTNACDGVIFEDYEQVREQMEKTETTTGLTVTAEIIEKEYETGRKADKDFIKNLNIIYDDDMPQWNYRIAPRRPIPNSSF